MQQPGAVVSRARGEEERGTRGLLRAVNEQLNKLAESADSSLESFDYVCECADSTCLTVVRVPRGQYSRISATAGCFVVADGHEGTSKTIVERRPGYLVVTRPAA